MISFFKNSSLENRIGSLVIVVTMISLLTMGIATRNLIYDNAKYDLGQRALELSKFISTLDVVKEAYKSDDPIDILQPLAESLRNRRIASFVVFMDMHGIRLSHPNTKLIGLHFTGEDEYDALNGKYYFSEAVGVSGPSIRGFSPIYDDNNMQIGVVSVGMFKDNIDYLLRENQNIIIYTMIFGFLVGIPGAIFLANSIKKIMHGMEPIDIVTLLNQRDTILNSVKEGIIFTDKDDRIALISETAQKLLGLTNDVVGMKVVDAIPTSRMQIVRQTGANEYNQHQIINDIVVITNRKVVKIDDEIVGVVATFTEKGEVQKLAEELTGVKEHVHGLRAKTHEFMNKLQSIYGLLELEEYEEAKNMISNMALKQQDIITFLSDRIKDPVTVGFLLGKIREAEELGIKLILNRESKLSTLPANFSSDAMVLVLGNLINNSIDAIKSTDKSTDGVILVTIQDLESELIITVEDNGPGLCLDREKIFEKGVSSKEGNRGYGLYLINNQVKDINRGTFIIDNIKEGGGTIAKINIPKV
ncbi:sensor histidine kinase [Proteiniborus sp.]|uniref:sensor histidine kinase n=1 Tax=Proteiniborus sp. TaxID=2079015 RepID=UPI00331F334A